MSQNYIANLSKETGSETTTGDLWEVPPESSVDIRKKTELSLDSIREPKSKVIPINDYRDEDSTPLSGSFDQTLFVGIIHQIVESTIRSALSKIPETRWIQNLRHPSYQLRQPIPVVIEREGDIVIAAYDDIDLYGTGTDIQEAISDLCAAIVEYYEGLKENENRLGDLPTQEYVFLKQMIIEVQ
ncbi:MAG: hypothetical protein O7E52_05080 [Candidatus Poribacteria bacterium]|nr:hypothetical protein [Candidatus Poribacteria bacterium]